MEIAVLLLLLVLHLWVDYDRRTEQAHRDRMRELDKEMQRMGEWKRTLESLQPPASRPRPDVPHA